MALDVGQILEGKYRIGKMLGEGGMGAVFEGENVRIHRRVAIKVLHANIATNADAVTRFEREAQAAGRIGSDHIVEVLDMGQLPSGERFMVMEYLDGESLSQRIQGQGRMDPRTLAPIISQLLVGLGAAHKAGIIHRDLKPDNVFLLRERRGSSDFVKILDFGISKFSPLSKDSGMSMTRTGSVMGTPFYMAPEQAKGAKDLDSRCDLYAVGVMLYEALAGQVPFNAETFNELLFKIVLEPVKPIEELVPELDAAFASIVRKAMARDPGERFQTAEQFAEALGSWASKGQGVSDRPWPAAAPVPNAGKRQDSPLRMTPAPWAKTGMESAPTDRPSSGRRTLVLAAIGAGCFCLGIGGVLLRAHRADTATPSAAAASSIHSSDSPRAAVAAYPTPGTIKPAATPGSLQPEVTPAIDPDPIAGASATAKTSDPPKGARTTSLSPAPHSTAKSSPPAPKAAPHADKAAATTTAAPTESGTVRGRKIRTEL